ncbi:MAG: ComF family protein [Bacteroidetes bacterium]|nr:ComF family protein [Bacteroidota bacterium]MBK8657946.1 ComF family protein [Bacteroidota bacterium]
MSNNWNEYKSELYRKLCGKIPLEGAASFYLFDKVSPVRKLVHSLKYKGAKEVGYYIGNKFGNLLTSNSSIIKDIDLIVPLPLHPHKLKVRGFNQCDPFADALSKTLNVPYETGALTRIVENVSQTKMDKHNRFTNVKKIFNVENKEILKSKHILLVDDVVTTGATSESCLATILEVPDTRVSFVAMAEVRSK